MSWKAVKDGLPCHDIRCLVRNEKGWMLDIMALYYENWKVFVLYDPNYRPSLTLDVTHYLEIPE